MPASPKEQKKKERKKNLNQIVHKCRHPSHVKRMLYYIIMSGRNNKLCDQRGQDPKGVGQAKKPTKRNSAAGQKDHFNVYGRQKNKSKKKRKTILNYKFELL